MHPNTCPCCYADTYEEIDDKGYDPAMREPTTGFCKTCEFRYFEHIEDPKRNQVLAHRITLKGRSVILNWNEIAECDKALGYQLSKQSVEQK